jgi:Zn-dependent peptidase ImmA (M78 family)
MGNYTVDGITGGTAKAQVFILLHELAHALDATGFLHDNGNPANGKINDQTINSQCANTLKQFSGTGSNY